MDLLEDFYKILDIKDQEAAAVMATKYQDNWARLVKKKPSDDFDPKLVAGVDVAYSKEENRVFSAVVVLDFESLEIQEFTWASDTPTFPYVPGLFSFRELPSLLLAIEKLSTAPDLFVCDAQGYAHPRRFGLASHLGVFLDIPSIGCAKNRLIGNHESVGEERGCYSNLEHQSEIIGRVLRTQSKIKPLYLSIGHSVSLEYSCKVILSLCTKYRLPQTTRYANFVVNSLLRGENLDVSQISRI